MGRICDGNHIQAMYSHHREYENNWANGVKEFDIFFSTYYTCTHTYSRDAHIVELTIRQCCCCCCINWCAHTHRMCCVSCVPRFPFHTYFSHFLTLNSALSVWIFVFAVFYCVWQKMRNSRVFASSKRTTESKEILNFASLT